jgi:beta-aspartyl-peptidase (threonine type)
MSSPSGRCVSALVALILIATAVPGGAGAAEAPSAPAERPAWALAIHGGAGAPGRDMPEERRRAYVTALSALLEEGRVRLERGDRALDVVEALVARMEDDPLFNAGRGAVFTADATHELDAAIMDGATLAGAGVAGLTTVRHPVALARLVMEKTSHVLLVGPGAERFADETGVERVANEWFSTPERREALEKARAEAAAKAASKGTVGAVALDRAGHLAAATSTGGMTNKRPGRVGDVPILGAGTWADDRSVAVSCTGWGEQFIRHGVAREVGDLVRGGLDLDAAARRLIFEVLPADAGGLVAVGRDGAIAMPFSTQGMFRGAVDSRGRFEVAIWAENEPQPAGREPGS